MISLANASVIVTGAGSGIGLALTRKLVACGCDVSAWDVDLSGLEDVPTEHLDPRRVDVSSRSDQEAAARAVLDRRGRIDGLVTCAAIFKACPFLELTDETIDRHVDVNLKGTLYSCQAVLPAMTRAKAGAIVMFSSSIARTGAVAGAHYAATKGGVLALARTLALEVAARGIRVNTVSPGITDTPQPLGNMSRDAMNERGGLSPLRRVGTADEMAEAAMFLLDDASSYLTGQDIRANGGVVRF